MKNNYQISEEEWNFFTSQSYYKVEKKLNIISWLSDDEWDKIYPQLQNM